MPIKRRRLEQAPVPPSLHIQYDILEEFGITQGRLAEALHVSRLSVNQLCNNKRAITAEMALRLERVSGIPAAHWMEIQADYDLWWAEQKAGAKLQRLVPLAKRASLGRPLSRRGKSAD
jgi:addiction module HigA family antidote